MRSSNALIRTLVIALAAAIAMPATQGCAPLLSAIPIVIEAATAASEVINAIESFVRGHDVHSPAVDEALVRTHAALAAVLDAARGTTDAHDKNLVAALDAFQAAYASLLEAVGPYGVHVAPEGGRLAVPSLGGLDVPAAATLRLSLERQ